MIDKPIRRSPEETRIERRPPQLVDLANFVPNHPERQVLLPPTQTSHNTVIDVPVNAAQIVNVSTTERDRSAGYLMRTLPLSLAFAVAIVIVAVALSEEPFFSWTAFIIFWLAFVGAWMFGEWRLGASSPFAANILEIKRKWDNIDANDMRRWDAWERATGIVPPADNSNSWIERYKWAIIAWAVVSLAFMLVTMLAMLEAL